MKESLLLETGEEAADCFDDHPQIVGDVVAGHAESELCRREPALAVTFRKTDQQGSKPLLGAPLSEQGQQRMVVEYLLAHDAQQLMLQAGDLLGQISQFLVRDFTKAGGLEGFGGTGMAPGTDSIKSEQFSREVEPRDLFVPVLGWDIGLDGARMDSVDRFEGGVHLKQVLTTSKGTPAFNDAIELFQLFVLNPNRDAELEESAIVTSHLYRIQVDDFASVAVFHQELPEKVARESNALIYARPIATVFCGECVERQCFAGHGLRVCYASSNY